MLRPVARRAKNTAHIMTNSLMVVRDDEPKVHPTSSVIGTLSKGTKYTEAWTSRTHCSSLVWRTFIPCKARCRRIKKWENKVRWSSFFKNADRRPSNGTIKSNSCTRKGSWVVLKDKFDMETNHRSLQDPRSGPL